MVVLQLGNRDDVCGAYRSTGCVAARKGFRKCSEKIQTASATELVQRALDVLSTHGDCLAEPSLLLFNLLPGYRTNSNMTPNMMSLGDGAGPELNRAAFN